MAAALLWVASLEIIQKLFKKLYDYPQSYHQKIGTSMLGCRFYFVPLQAYL